MSSSSEQRIGVFNIVKGAQNSEIKLAILPPRGTDSFEYEAKSDGIVINKGLYAAFIGVKSFYGLLVVDDIEVRLTSEAKFSDKGACVSQTQKTEFVFESAIVSCEVPTVIYVNDIFACFLGVDIVVNFAEQNETLHQRVNPELHVYLTTKNEGSSVCLLPSKPDSHEAFLFTQLLGAVGNSDVVCTDEARRLSAISSQSVVSSVTASSIDHSFLCKILTMASGKVGVVLLAASLLMLGLVAANLISFPVGATLAGVGLFAGGGLLAAASRSIAHERPNNLSM